MRLVGFSGQHIYTKSRNDRTALHDLSEQNRNLAMVYAGKGIVANRLQRHESD